MTALIQVSFAENGLIFMERTSAPIMPIHTSGRASLAVFSSSLSLMVLYLLVWDFYHVLVGLPRCAHEAAGNV